MGYNTRPIVLSGDGLQGDDQNNQPNGWQPGWYNNALAPFGGLGGPFESPSQLLVPASIIDGQASRAAHRGSKITTNTTTSTTGSSGTPTSGGTSTGAFTINVHWDSSVTSAPTGFTAGVLAAVQYLENVISSPVAINIDVGYGEVNGSALGGSALGESQWYLSSVGYSQLASALAADATSATDASAVASLPTTSPVNGAYWLTTAQAQALGLAPAASSSVNGYVGFSSSLPFTYNDSSGVASGTYDFEGVALHEITEVMGRALLTGTTIGSTSNSYSLYDLFHYSAPGVRDFSPSTPGYFSVDGGTTDLAAFNTASGGDAGDWASSVVNDAFDAFSSSGVINGVSAADLSALDAIGWNLASTTSSPPPTPPTPSQPTGVAISPAISGIAAVQISTGLASGALATVNQIGGAATDNYSYSLGGSDAAAFTLSSVNNVGSLDVGPTGAPGSLNGKVYALTLTANDTTAGTASPAQAIDVVVGSSGNDTIQLASLLGAGTAATPTLIYGLSGADTINASGMTGEVWFVSGAGADIMTGGSGVNDYMYGAVSDSTATAMDIITDFHPATDVIDLTGLGAGLSVVGQIGSHGKNANTLSANSIGWQTSGGNTFVYVNTSLSRESLGATNMKVELEGAVSLASSNFLHQ